MEDLVPILIAIGALYGIYRLFSGPSAPSPPVPQEQVDSVKSMFPQIDEDRIRYDLSRTRSVERTCDTILRTGSLPAPPPGFVSRPTTPTTSSRPAAAAPAAQPAPSASAQSETLISRFHLESRVSDKGKAPEQPLESVAPEEWADSADKREAALRERKARMVLEARRKLSEKQQKKAEARATA